MGDRLSRIASFYDASFGRTRRKSASRPREQRR